MTNSTPEEIAQAAAVSMCDLRAQLAAAVEALQTYGIHEADCSWMQFPELRPKVRCDCGLDAALAGGRKDG